MGGRGRERQGEGRESARSHVWVMRAKLAWASFGVNNDDIVLKYVMSCLNDDVMFKQCD